MNEQNPTNADLYQTMGTILERIDQNHTYYKTELSEIKKQAKLTNGRVTKLEKWREELNIAQKAIQDYKNGNKSSQSLLSTPEFLNLINKLTWFIGIVGGAIAVYIGTT